LLIATFVKNVIVTQENLIYGKHPIIEAIEANKTIDVLFTQKDLKSEVLNEIRLLAKHRKIPIKAVPIEKLNKLTYNKNHQGVVAFLASVVYYDKDDILNKIYENGEVPLFLILDGVTDVRNMGAIARTAYGCGVHALIVPARGSAQMNPETMKASAGALNNLPICREIDLVQVLKWCKLNGLDVLVSDLKANKELPFIDMKERPLAIVIGEESTGVNQLLINRADATFKIPINKNLDSYNVSVATGMILYELIRQRIPNTK
jgi:23S rRNA (guanosine2251-2'-O)-methyltransferase